MQDVNKIEVFSGQKLPNFCTQVIGEQVLSLHNRINKKASVIYLLRALYVISLTT
jgi:hypothetical protein